MPRRTWHDCQPPDLHKLARTWFFNARRIELQKLAVELGISRATAYRWAGSAEQLVGEVLASLVDEGFRRFARDATSRGPERILDILNRGMRSAHHSKPLRKFMEKDPQLALRVVASKEGPVQARTIRGLQQLLEEEVKQGRMTLPVEAPVMAYALTRIMESFLYADLITGAAPDVDNASKIIAIMLQQA